MRKLFIKLFQGGYSVKVGKKYLNFPKLAPYGTVGILTMGISNEFTSLPLFMLGAFLTGLTFFMFIYFIIKPLNRDEIAEFYPEVLDDYDRLNDPTSYYKNKKHP